ncbi:phosphate ABC transporter substrate-binding protein [Flavivirga aquatica]|uniref:Phosphate ABC transporter substrate-binding protein n=1 Tax=Flavivirga aquatica TaxID=1849968 RepID=A0A1E5SIB9_9FLAO|nr:sulfatase [Flavivirga aquatica]OEJ98816.1 phosphate ABC transporter substrate-binding protein [Flavivirga aquatica]
MKNQIRSLSFILLFVTIANCQKAQTKPKEDQNKKPNILWIIAEDLSPFMGCYGDSINKNSTPVIDKLAKEGVLFKRAYATAPVCSASRSALITGVMQTTTGTHHHRSSRTTDGVIVPDSLRIKLPHGVKTIPELMRDAGYFTFNSGKDDYNFHYDRTAMYSVGTEDNYKPGMNGWQGNKAKDYLSFTVDNWNARKDKNQPWFGQMQIMGGKKDAKYVRAGEKLAINDVALPPYFPNIPSQRAAWTGHYNANRGSDVRVEQLLKQLEADGELENTIIFFFSDHGSPTSLRHKQFCYEGGMLVPLIINGNHPNLKSGTVRNDLVSLLDVSATTLALGKAETPKYLDGQNLFEKKYREEEYIVGARDRCDFTIDKIRTVASKKYRYIKNYFPERPMLQAGYRDNRPIVKDLKKARKDGKLTAYQEAHWFGVRPVEELYDLDKDPHQINNLAKDLNYAKELEKHRQYLEQWIKETNDQGQQPEQFVQLRETYNLWKERPRFKNAKVNPEYDQFK